MDLEASAMAILMDRPNLWDAHSGASANLISDLEGEKGRRELMAFTRRMGLDEVRRSQLAYPAERLEVFGNEIAAARRAGAREVSLRKLVRVLRGKRETSSNRELPRRRRSGRGFLHGFPFRMKARLGFST